MRSTPRKKAISTRCSASVRIEKKTHRLQAWEKHAIAGAYHAGEKIDAIASEFGVSPQYVGMLAERFGHKRRPNGRPVKVNNQQKSR
jgi:hypothetical protein